MRIFVASGIFHPTTGGPATYLYRLLPELLACGHEMRVLAYGDGPLTGYPYPVTRIPYITLPLRLPRYARAYREGAAWADLMYLNSLSLPRTGERGKPRVMKVVGDYAWERAVNRGWVPPTEDIDVFQTRRYGPLVEWFKRSRRREVQSMDHIIVPSEYLRQLVIGWGAKPERVQVIYNALEAGNYHLDLSRNEARRQVGWQLDGKYLLTAARLTAWKGINYLIEALSQVPDVRLVVAGDGDDRAALERRVAECSVQDRVTFLGKVPHDKLALYMRAADYLALYSGYEGLSHTILESLYAGTPVIASNRCGNPEIIRHGENGLLVKHPDTNALVAAIREAFTGDTQQRLAVNTQKNLERFQWSTLVDQTVDALVNVKSTYKG
jgi:glycosyltransferase involved in cell wall biosynthesis